MAIAYRVVFLLGLGLVLWQGIPGVYAYVA